MRQEIKSTREESARMLHNGYHLRPEAHPQPILDALFIQRDDVIVELGAGIGHLTLPIARKLDNLAGSGVIFACDVSKTLADVIHRHAITRGVAGHLRVVDLTERKPLMLPFEDERVDSVLAVNLIQYLADPVPYLIEIARILAPCGSLLMADWRQVSTLFDSVPPPKGLTPEELYPLLDAAGMEAHVPLDLDGYSWTIRAMKPLVVLS